MNLNLIFGVKNYYKPNDSIKIFDELDIGMNILKFDTVVYSEKIKKLTFDSGQKRNKSISGSIIRNNLLKGLSIPKYLIREELSKIIIDEYKLNPNNVLEK